MPVVLDHIPKNKKYISEKLLEMQKYAVWLGFKSRSFSVLVSTITKMLAVAIFYTVCVAVSVLDTLH